MSNARFSFAFLTDPQVGLRAPNGFDADDSDRARLDKAIDVINDPDRNLDFVIFGGDVTHKVNFDKQLDVFKACVARLKVPYYLVPGNHDELDPRECESILFESGFTRQFSFVHKQTSFLGVNANNLRGSFGDELKEAEWQYMRDHFAGLPDTLNHRFVVMHWPLFVEHPDEEDTYWNFPDREELSDFFAEQDVSCVLSGHWHNDIDSSWKGVRYITSIGTCCSLQHPEECSFKIINVFDGGWMVKRDSVER